jgi:hypothetical protein
VFGLIISMVIILTETTELDLLLGVEPIAIGDIILTEVSPRF